MAVPGLQLQYSDFTAELGFFAGWGRDSAKWTTDQTAQIAAWVQAGNRQYLTPPILPGEQKMHVWSFLKPRDGSITTVADTATYDLPDDFGGLVGLMTIEDSARYPLTLVNEGQVHGQVYPDTTGRPTLVALRAKAVDATVQQQFELLLFPVPDGVYTLSYRYTPAGESLSAAAPYPMGGAMHSETLLESCLAIAESRLNDTAGIHYQRFIDRLRGGVAYDRQLTAPNTLGYNADRSDMVSDEQFVADSSMKLMYYEYSDGTRYPSI